MLIVGTPLPNKMTCQYVFIVLDTDWVDNNRAKLIQSVTSVMPIADEMVEQKIIHNEMYANIMAASTSQEKMRALYTALTSTKAKCAFYRILQDIQPEISESM